MAWTEVTGQYQDNTFISAVVELTDKLYAYLFSKGLFRLDNTTWTQVAPPIKDTYNNNSYTYNMIVVNSEIYAADAANGILYKWDGISDWILLAPSNDSTGVTKLLIIGSNIFGVTFYSKLLRWNGSNAWVLVATALQSYDAYVSALVLNGSIYCATINHFMLWNGVNAWVNLSNDTYMNLFVHNNTVWANKQNIGTYSFVGSSWNLQAIGITDEWFEKPLVADGEIYTTTNAKSFYRLVNLTWTLVNSPYNTESPYALIYFGNRIYAGSNGTGLLLLSDYPSAPYPTLPAIYLCQRTNRQVIKCLNLSSHLYESHFGAWQTIKTDNTGLNFPWGITTDGTYLYVCDNNNKRIVKLDSSTMSFVASVDISVEIGEPFAIFYDTLTSNLYVTGVHDLTLSIASITTSLVVSKYNNNIELCNPNQRPMGISRGFVSGDFLISGVNNNLYRVTETASFSTAVSQVIVGEVNSKYTGNLKHTNGDLYLIKQSIDGSWICRVTTGYINIGDSKRISKYSYVLSQGNSGTLLVSDYWNKKVLRYDENLNFIETIYEDNGVTIDLDAAEICGIVET